MDDHQVDVVQAEGFERAVDRCRRLVIGLCLRGQLGGNKEILPAYAAGSDPFADASLILIGLGRIDVAVAGFNGVSYRLRRIIVTYKTRYPDRF